MTHATLLLGPERRRRWHEDERLRILEAAFAPGAVVSQVARNFQISTGLIYTWRRQALQQGVAPAFAPAVIIDEHPPTAPVPQQAAITIELSRGVRVSIAAHAPAALVTAALRALR
jgi:transposase